MVLKLNPITGELDLVGSDGAAAGETKLTGDVGTVVSPNASDNIDLIGDATQGFIETTGTPASNKMEIKLVKPDVDGQLLIGHTANGEPTAATLTAGSGITITNGAGAITVASTATSSLSAPTDSGTANAVAGVMSFVGGTGANTAGSGNTVTINASPDVPTAFTTDAGTGTPVGNSLAVNGGTGINTSGAGAGITVNLDDPVIVALGGSGRQTHTAYSVICGGTSTTGAQQSVVSVGTAAQVLTSNGAGLLPTFQNVAGGGDVTGPGSSTDNAVARFDGTTGKIIQNSAVIIDDSDNVSGIGTLAMAGDLTDYEVVNDGNPQIRLGATDAEELHIQSVYDTGAQTLDYVLFQTDVASGTADKGLFRFNVDGSDVVDIDDGGLDLMSGYDVSIASTSVLNANTLGAGVVNSSLTKVGTLVTGVWNATKITEIYGGTNQSAYTTGDILYSDATNSLEKLSVGTTGQVLTVAAGVPSWAAAGSSGSGLVWLKTVTASASTSLEIKDVIDSTYNMYLFVIEDLASTNDFTDLRLRTSSDNGVSFDSGASDYGYNSFTSFQSSNLNNEDSTGTTSIRVYGQGGGGATSRMGNQANENLSGRLYLHLPSTSEYKKMNWNIGGIDSSANAFYNSGCGYRKSTSAINAVQFLAGGGTLASGTIKVYGMTTPS